MSGRSERGEPAAEHAPVRVRVTAPGPVTAPTRGDGGRYRYELIYEGGRWRAYADELDSLAAVLTPDGRSFKDVAVWAQVILQARINVTTGLDGCDKEETSVLSGDRADAPVLDRWSAPVPLVLVADFYAPHTHVSRPVAVPPGQIIWLSAVSARELLVSLDAAGVVRLNERS